jgi:hypothetical protein
MHKQELAPNLLPIASLENQSPGFQTLGHTVHHSLPRASLLQILGPLLAHIEGAAEIESLVELRGRICVDWVGKSSFVDVRGYQFRDAAADDSKAGPRCER